MQPNLKYWTQSITNHQLTGGSFKNRYRDKNFFPMVFPGCQKNAMPPAAFRMPWCHGLSHFLQCGPTIVTDVTHAERHVRHCDMGPTANEGRWGDIFIPSGICACFWQNKNFSKYNKFVFSGQERLRIIVELLKNPLAPLKRFSKTGWYQENFWPIKPKVVMVKNFSEYLTNSSTILRGLTKT